MSARRSTRAAAGWTGMEAREPGEPEGCSQELAALVEHALFDHVIRALADLRLITNSNFVGCSMGRSAGLAPLRIRSTKRAVWR